MNLLLWATQVTEEHYPHLEKIKSTGFDGVEIPIFGGDEAHYQKLRKKLDELELKSSTVTVATPEASAISSDPAIRRAAAERVDPFALGQTLADGHAVGEHGGQVLAQLGRVGPGPPGDLDGEHLGPAAVAVLTGGTATVGLVALWHAYSSRAQAESRIFNERDDAVAWLRAHKRASATDSEPLAT